VFLLDCPLVAGFLSIPLREGFCLYEATAAVGPSNRSLPPSHLCYRKNTAKMILLSIGKSEFGENFFAVGEFFFRSPVKPVVWTAIAGCRAINGNQAIDCAFFDYG